MSHGDAYEPPALCMYTEPPALCMHTGFHKRYSLAIASVTSSTRGRPPCFADTFGWTTYGRVYKLWVVESIARWSIFSVSFRSGDAEVLRLQRQLQAGGSGSSLFWIPFRQEWSLFRRLVYTKTSFSSGVLKNRVL